MKVTITPENHEVYHVALIADHPDCKILHIHLEKPEIAGFGHSAIVLKNGDCISFNDLPWENHQILAHVDRDTVFVTIVDYKLIEKVSYGQPNMLYWN